MRSQYMGNTRLLVRILALALVLVLVLVLVLALSGNRSKPPIRVGVLHSLTGTMAISEAPLVDALRLAVEETNQSGGINGHSVEMIVEDCRSDAAYCAQQAEKLISRDGVKALFGCWTSQCRIAVKAIVEKHQHLLFYPVQYEGLERSSSIIYTGSTPNQQVIPMVLWALQEKGKRFYLVGSDYIFARIAGLMARDTLYARGGQLLGEHYLPLGASDWEAIARDIARQRPDFVVNLINGDSNRHFFHALQQAGVRADGIPVFSTSIAEVEIASIGPSLTAGHYAVRGYFQSLENDTNQAFVERFKQRFGRERVLDSPMEASYNGMKLWVDAARHLGSTDIDLLKNILKHESMAAPEGIVAVDYNTQHLWRTSYVGKARPNGQFEIIWQSPQPIRPAPFPFYRSKVEWQVVKQALTGGEP